MNFSCCSKDPIWVENVPGKGYYFCQECRNEVLEPKLIDSPIKDQDIILSSEVQEAIDILLGYKI